MKIVNITERMKSAQQFICPDCGNKLFEAKASDLNPAYSKEYIAHKCQQCDYWSTSNWNK